MTRAWIARASAAPARSTTAVAVGLTGRGGRVHVGGGPVVAGGAGDGRPGCDRLEAAAQAARADRAVGVDDDVADLAGEAARSAVDGAVDHDAGADAGADAEVDEVADVAQRPAVEDPGGRRPDVVLDRAREPPGIASSRSRSGSRCQPRLTASETTPVAGSTRPGTPTPTARTSRIDAPAPARAASIGARDLAGRLVGLADRAWGSCGGCRRRGPRRRRGRRSCCRRRRRRRTARRAGRRWPSGERWASAPVVVIGPGSGRARG